MTLRTKLVLAFLLLSVLPLSGIVGYSYLSSTRAFRQAVEAESREMAAEIGERMAEAREQVQAEVDGFSPSDMSALFGVGRRFIPDEVMADLEKKLNELPWLQSLEVVPSGTDEAKASQPGDWQSRIWIRRNAERSAREARDGSKDPELPDARQRAFSILRSRPPAAPTAPGAIRERAAAALEAELARLNAELEAQRERAATAAREFSEGQGGAHEAMDRALEKEVLEREVAALEKHRAHMKKVLGKDFISEIRAPEGVIATVKAAVDLAPLLRDVWKRVGLDARGVPFAVEDDGKVYTMNEKARASLERLGAAVSAGTSRDGRTMVADEGWLVVAQRDPGSSLSYGIARPIAEPLAEIRRASVTNFAVGLGLIVLALLGILPLSNRMTKSLNSLATEAERLAAGDWSARAEVGSRDEIGQLALAFNHMAGQLEENQRRLVDQELRERLLEAENERRGQELEEARQFQLSLLPKELPQVPGLELAVFMRTATEVGGDYYDFKELGPGGVIAAVGDATGHGAMAGTMVTAIKSLFSARCDERPLADFLSETSETLKSMQLGRMTMGLLLARFKDNQMEVASAGMPPLLIYRAAEGRVEEVTLEGLPLGALTEARYQSVVCALEEGDCVLLSSDGLPELVGSDDSPFGYERVRARFAELALAAPESVIEGLSSTVDDWMQGHPPTDDVTFVVVRRAILDGGASSESASQPA